MYADSKDLAEKTVSDKVLKSRPDEIVLNNKSDGSQREFAGMVYNVFDKKTGLGANIKKWQLKNYS